MELTDAYTTLEAFRHLFASTFVELSTHMCNVGRAEPSVQEGIEATSPCWPNGAIILASEALANLFLN